MDILIKGYNNKIRCFAISRLNSILLDVSLYQDASFQLLFQYLDKQESRPVRKSKRYTAPWCVVQGVERGGEGPEFSSTPVLNPYSSPPNTRTVVPPLLPFHSLPQSLDQDRGSPHPSPLPTIPSPWQETGQGFPLWPDRHVRKHYLLPCCGIQAVPRQSRQPSLNTSHTKHTVMGSG